MTAFYPYFEDGLLDAGQTLDETILWGIRDDSLAAVEEDLQRLIQDSPDEATAMENLMPWLDQTGLPDGSTYRNWLLAVHARVLQGLTDPTSIPDPGPDQGHDTKTIPRVSWYLDDKTANHAATLVLRAHEHPLRAWAGNPGGWWRQHYYVPDLGFRTGSIITRKDQEIGEPVNGAVVIMKLHDQTREPFILNAYPEITMPTAIREQLPDLCHLLGGYFGQHCPDEGGPLRLQQNFQASTTTPARTRVAEQLGQLLLQDDDLLRQDVKHLGAYISPHALRPWLQRMHWRINAFDWTLRPTN